MGTQLEVHFLHVYIVQSYTVMQTQTNLFFKFMARVTHIIANQRYGPNKEINSVVTIDRTKILRF